MDYKNYRLLMLIIKTLDGYASQDWWEESKLENLLRTHIWNLVNERSSIASFRLLTGRMEVLDLCKIDDMCVTIYYRGRWVVANRHKMVIEKAMAAIDRYCAHETLHQQCIIPLIKTIPDERCA